MPVTTSGQEAILPGDWFLIVLIAAVAAITLVAFLFAVFAIRLRLKNHRTAQRWAALEDKWTPVILDVLSGAQPRSALLDRVAPGDGFHFVEFLYRYARRIRGSERDVIAELACPYLAPLGERVRHGDAEQRARAVQTLSVLDLEHHTDAVVSALDDPAPLVAMVAARALSRPEHAPHTGEVLARIHRFVSWSPRFLSSMLASIGPAATPALRATFMDAEQPVSTRAVAADALAMLNDFAAADLAVQLLELDADPELLAASLRVLQRVGRPPHLATVRRLCDSPHFAVRAQAMGALRHVAGDEDIERLRNAIGDSSPWVALHAARALRYACGDAALKTAVGAEHPNADIARQILSE